MNKYDYIIEKLQEKIDAKLLPAVSLTVFEDGKEVYRNHINYKGNEIFRLASMTKPITAVATLKAIELGLFNIDDEISKYIDGFSNMKIGKMENGIPVFDKYASKIITIKDILRHQSGIGSDVVGYYQMDHRVAPKTLKEAVDDYKNWYLDFEPGSKAAYSGTTALDIINYIIELTSKMPYYEFLKKYILDPLEMKDTTYKLSESQKKRLAPMYDMVGEDNNRHMVLKETNTYEGFFGMVEGYPCGAASLMASLDDYSHFVNMLSNKGIYKGVRVLKEESILNMANDIITPYCKGVDKFFNWGYAVFVRGEKAEGWQPLKKGTFGWSGAYSPHFFVNLEDKIGVVMMTQLENDGGAGSPNIKVLEKAFSEIVNQDND